MTKKAPRCIDCGRMVIFKWERKLHHSKFGAGQFYRCIECEKEKSKLQMRRRKLKQRPYIMVDTKTSINKTKR